MGAKVGNAAECLKLQAKNIKQLIINQIQNRLGTKKLRVPPE
jgi:hypothetical protein